MLFIIELSTRRVEIAGIASEPDSAWMSQVSRNMTDVSDGFLTGKRLLIHDRDPLFTVAFRETLADAGVQSVRLPPRSPNLNAYAERFVRTIKESCLDRHHVKAFCRIRQGLGIRHFKGHVEAVCFGATLPTLQECGDVVRGRDAGEAAGRRQRCVSVASGHIEHALARAKIHAFARSSPTIWSVVPITAKSPDAHITCCLALTEAELSDLLTAESRDIALVIN